MPAQLTTCSSAVPLVDRCETDMEDCERLQNGFTCREGGILVKQVSVESAESLDNDQVELQIITSSDIKLKKCESSSEESSLDDMRACCPCCPGCHPCQSFKLWVEAMQNAVSRMNKKHSRTVKIVLAILFLLAYFSYLGWAVVCNNHRALPLIIITVLVAALFIIAALKKALGEKLNKALVVPMCERIDRVWFVMKWFVYASVLCAVAVYVSLVINPRPYQLVSVLGVFVFLFLTFIFSKHPGKVNMRPVVWGIGLQLVFGILILRTRWGHALFHYMGQSIMKFLEFTNEGSRFLFGENYMDHLFAFKILPVVVFFSSVISILYHLGIMQFVVQKIAWIMQKTMQTAATESLIAASNIFIGQAEAPILVRPFIEQMTMSELHAMMTAGFATIAGGVMAAYITFGIPAEDLLCASVMNAPIALAVSKLAYPETEKSKSAEDIELPKGTERNVLEAASAGASASISLVANIAANLVSFLALLAFVNAMISWAGSMVDHPEWTFQLLCSYLFMPIAWLMGTEWEDCGLVAELLGIKIFLNEFVAYQKLSMLIKNRQEGLQPAISVRSQMIVTYALCGFANLSSIAIQLGGISPMAPARKSDLAQLAMRALVAGTTACYITACMAGILTMEDGPVSCIGNSTLINNTCIEYIQANITSQLP